MRKIDIGGRPLNVASDEDMRTAPPGSVYCLVRVEDVDPKLGTPELKRRRIQIACEGILCGALCWFDPQSFGCLPAHVPKLCAQCILARARAEEIKKINLRTWPSRGSNFPLGLHRLN